MPRRAVGPVWTVLDRVRITVVPDSRSSGKWICRAFWRDTGDRRCRQYPSQADAVAAAERLAGTLAVELALPAPGAGRQPLDAGTVRGQAASCERCSTTTARLVRDHDHATGTFRGWLCHPCNIHVGWYETSQRPDELVRTEAYLAAYIARRRRAPLGRRLFHSA